MINIVQIQLNFEQSVKITNYEEKENKHLKKKNTKKRRQKKREVDAVAIVKSNTNPKYVVVAKKLCIQHSIACVARENILSHANRYGN